MLVEIWSLSKSLACLHIATVVHLLLLSFAGTAIHYAVVQDLTLSWLEPQLAIFSVDYMHF